MSSVNNCLLSVNLTPKTKPEGESLRRLATYKFYDGKTKSNVDAMVTLVGWGKMAETLSKLQDGEVVAEGRLNLGDIPNSKEKRLELIVSRIHF
jgi:hypothetical protein